MYDVCVEASWLEVSGWGWCLALYIILNIDIDSNFGTLL